MPPLASFYLCSVKQQSSIFIICGHNRLDAGFLCHLGVQSWLLGISPGPNPKPNTGKRRSVVSCCGSSQPASFLGYELCSVLSRILSPTASVVLSSHFPPQVFCPCLFLCFFLSRPPRQATWLCWRRPIGRTRWTLHCAGPAASTAKSRSASPPPLTGSIYCEPFSRMYRTILMQRNSKGKHNLCILSSKNQLFIFGLPEKFFFYSPAP